MLDGKLLCVFFFGVLISGYMAVGEDLWAFDPGPDNFEDSALLDLRHLNEKEAGENGFIRVSDDGNGFVRGDGAPIRFWAAASFYGRKKTSDEELARHARFLAKLGVNCVRVGGANSGLIPQKKGCGITDINEFELEKIWRIVAAMKKEGIYTRFSPFWDHGSVKYIGEDWGLDGYESGDTLNALLFFEPNLQTAWKAWMKKLLTEKNPYTGIPLKDDPGLAIIQIVSEDTLFFYWTDRIKGGPKRILETMFANFAKGKYGSIEKAFAAWKQTKISGDAAAEGRLGLYRHWVLEQWPAEGEPRRVRDQLEFMSQLERGFFEDMKRYLKDELGAKQIIGASNFGSAGERRLGDLQRWCWTAGEVMERNSFFSSNLVGKHAAWRVQSGHKYVPRSGLLDPDLPTNRKQVPGIPFNISSTNWVPPNDYYAEGPILNAVYGAMHGLDGIYWLGCTAPGYDDPYFRFTEVNGSHPMKRWTISHPAFMSQFPAAALIFRKRLVSEAEVVVHEERVLEDILLRRAPLIAEEPDYSPTEHADEIPEAQLPLINLVCPESFLVGRVEVKYGDDPAGTAVKNLDVFINQKTGEISSVHRQLTLDRANGLLKIDAPQVQGVLGFLSDAGGEFQLSALSVESNEHYASVLAVSLDDRPLKESGKILLQIGTQAFPRGWETKAASFQKKDRKYEGLEIVSTGDLPWMMRNVDAKIRITNKGLSEAVLLDVNGYPAGTVPLKKLENNTAEIVLPEKAVYLILR